jgi:tripartite ATP-independent transporter DctP family solute receptor
MQFRRTIGFVLASTFCVAINTGAQAQEIQERNIKFGTINNTDHPISFGVRKFAEIVAAKTGGKFKVKEYPNSTLGSDSQQQSALQGGVQEMTVPATTSLAGMIKEYGLLDFPFAVSNSSQADALLDGPLGQLLSSKLPAKGLISLGYWELGFRNVTNSKRPIVHVEDLQGLKLRVIPNEVFLASFKALGANPVPMPIGEVYTAMETKTIDGHENPFSVILSNKFYEVQKYVSATNHVYGANILLVSKIFWDKLSPTEKKIMQDSAREAIAYERTLARAAAVKSVADLQAAGMQYNTLVPAELAKMAAIVKPVTEKFAASYDPAVMKVYNEELAKARKAFP